jgi:hypothetical protein
MEILRVGFGAEMQACGISFIPLDHLDFLPHSHSFGQA